MKEAKEIAYCITPYIVTTFIMYLLGSFVSASWNVMEWDRHDREFFVFMAAVFGFALMNRLDFGREHDL